MVEIKNYLTKINQLKGLMELSGLEPLTLCMQLNRKTPKFFSYRYESNPKNTLNK